MNGFDDPDQDHLRDDPTLPGGREWDGRDEEAVEDRRRTPIMRPLMMTSAEAYDFDLGSEL